MELSVLARDLEEVLQAVVTSPSTSSGRQNAMVDYTWKRLKERLPPHLWTYLQKEARVPGLAREKRWDLGLVYPMEGIRKKPRLLISFKSILANPSGSWPNRLDDLVGEVSSVHMLFPEVVIGYTVIVDLGAPTKRKLPQQSEFSAFERFGEGLKALSRREPPLWTQGLIEGHWLVEIDTRKRPILQNPIRAAKEGEEF
ncbi:MAG: hypothetical protein P3W93_010115, partial [Thermus sp.]|nr:hypothetical protein [Thermus sp.]